MDGRQHIANVNVSSRSLKTKGRPTLKPNSITLSSSKLVADMFEAGRRPASNLSATMQLRTSCRNVHQQPKRNNFFSLWPWTLTFDLDLDRISNIQVKGHMVQKLESQQTHWTDCSTIPTRVKKTCSWDSSTLNIIL